MCFIALSLNPFLDYESTGKSYISFLFCTETYSECGWQSVSIRIYTFTITIFEKDKEQKWCLAGMTPLGCLCYNTGRYMNQCVGERLKPLKLCPRAHQGLADNSQAICAPFPAGPNLRCNFCSCQSFFLSPRLFCKNTSCSEGSLPFINSETERSRAGRGTKRRERQGIKSSPNKPSFLCKLELEVSVK